MTKKLKDYLEYRKSKKIARREFAKMAATALPAVREISDKGTDIVNFIVRILNETNNIEGERLIEIVLSEVSKMLNTDNNRIIEILTYMASLSPDDMNKILVHSTVETLPTDKNE